MIDITGKIIKVIGSASIFPDFLGRYGVAIEKVYGNRWLIEFNARIKDVGSLSYTVSEDDFVVIGTTFESI